MHAFGDAPRLDAIDRPDDPGRGELLVEVSALGVGAWDVGVADGRLEKLLPSGDLPFTMGAELCGRVVAVGESVDGFSVGDRVIANPGVVGAWAERVRLKASACAAAPLKVDDVAAATLPVPGLAAWQGLELLDVPADATLLVVGAGGSVGRAAVEMAQGRSIRVIAIAGAGELDVLEQLGAARAIDYRGEWTARVASEAPSGVHAVLDLVGGDSLEQAFGLVREGARVVSTVANEARIQPPDQVSFEFLKMKCNGETLAAVSRLVDEGGLTPHVVKTFSFDDAPAALEAVRASDRAPGEIVLRL